MNKVCTGTFCKTRQLVKATVQIHKLSVTFFFVEFCDFESIRVSFIAYMFSISNIWGENVVSFLAQLMRDCCNS